MTLSLPLTANADGNESATATIRFVSAPLAINNPNTFMKELAYSEAVANTEILASGASGLSLWHRGNAGFLYMLVGVGNEDFVVDTGGKIAIGGNRLEGDSSYNLQLQLRGVGALAVTATREIQVNVGAAPVEPVEPIASRADLVSVVAKGNFNWFGGWQDCRG